MKQTYLRFMSMVVLRLQSMFMMSMIGIIITRIIIVGAGGIIRISFHGMTRFPGAVPLIIMIIGIMDLTIDRGGAGERVGRIIGVILIGVVITRITPMENIMKNVISRGARNIRIVAPVQLLRIVHLAVVMHWRNQLAEEQAAHEVLQQT